MLLYETINDTFPAGYVPVVRTLAKDAGIALEVIDKRQPPAAIVDADLSWLRDYQLVGVEKALKATRGILKMPTGSGKTEVAIGLVQRVPCDWLFLTHRRTLLDQTADRYFARTGKRPHKIGKSEWARGDEGTNLTVAMFPTLSAALTAGSKKKRAVAQRILESAGGIIVDEAHVLPANTFYKVAMRTRNAYYRIGLSATPLARGDQGSVYTIAALGPLIYKLRADPLIAQGVLSRPVIKMVSLMQSATTGASWPEVYRECVVDSVERNALVLRAALRAPKPCMVFVKEIDHGNRLLEGLRDIGYEAEFVHGGTEADERRARCAALGRGALDVLVASVVLQEGLDIPELRSIVVAGGGASAIAALQRVGRAMRVADGKRSCEVFDFADRGNKYLERHTRKRREAYTKEGYEIVPVSL